MQRFNGTRRPEIANKGERRAPAGLRMAERGSEGAKAKAKVKVEVEAETETEMEMEAREGGGKLNSTSSRRPSVASGELRPASFEGIGSGAQVQATA